MCLTPLSPCISYIHYSLTSIAHMNRNLLTKNYQYKCFYIYMYIQKDIHTNLHAHIRKTTTQQQQSTSATFLQMI